MLSRDYHLPFVLLAGLGLLSACAAGGPGDTRLAKTSEGTSASPVLAEPVMVDAEPAAISSARIAPSHPHRPPRAGIVTAGDIDDTRNFAAFRSYLKRKGGSERPFSRPVLVQLSGPDGKPAPGVYYTLRKPGAKEPFHTGYSGVDGHINAFPKALGAGQPQNVELRLFAEDQDGTTVRDLRTGPTRHKIVLARNTAWKPAFLDLVFVVDTTGSMGDELDWLTREMREIVKTARRAAPGVDIRYGLVAYRDHGDAYVLRNLGFTGSARTMQGWLDRQRANGGGDYPEAAAAALQSAVSLNWRRGKGERIVIHIADAPPHSRDANRYLDAARAAARRNIQVYGLGASGVGDEAEILMRQAAAMTSGRYLFLTDDSGVGHAHAEPDIACYRVTRLKTLMINVLKSELSGIRHEATAQQVVREVGAYRRGVCLN
ncbi:MULTISPECIES: vWA domain-containing protein [unclassified Roseovarius]|uniref:vWA domain-containing protein n=1 Tax=unclassified Roseovarius TaxID=2614913 RepID=UPI00273D58AE|nr:MULTISPECIES: vWA domain-containing protein [unclassified Roseovarius]